MARLKNAVTGVVVEVDDGDVERLGGEWVPAEPETVKRGPGRPKKSE